MGQLATLPSSAVGAQFGEAGERLQQLARGHDPRPLIPRKRPERHAAHAIFEPPAEGITEIALALRRLTGELCDTLRARHLAPGRALLTLRLEDAPRLRVELAFPEPALEPDWIARLLIGRLEQATRAQNHATGRGATHHRHRPGLRPPRRPGNETAPCVRGTRGPLGGAALVAGTADDALRGGPPLAGQPRPAERVPARTSVQPGQAVTRLYLDHPLIQVETDDAGIPLRLRLDGETHGEVGICNRWRVDDDWWREPTARSYFKLVTRDGLLCTVYLDEMRGTWHLERIFD